MILTIDFRFSDCYYQLGMFIRMGGGVAICIYLKKKLRLPYYEINILILHLFSMNFLLSSRLTRKCDDWIRIMLRLLAPAPYFIIESIYSSSSQFFSLKLFEFSLLCQKCDSNRINKLYATKCLQCE